MANHEDLINESGSLERRPPLFSGKQSLGKLQTVQSAN
jgi:hypothetical protein